MDTTNHCTNCEALAKEVEKLRKAMANDISKVADLLAEIKSLRKAVAVKDEALRAAIDKFGNRKIGVYVHHVEYVPLDRVLIKRMEAALSSTPSGMVLVDAKSAKFAIDSLGRVLDAITDDESQLSFDLDTLAEFQESLSALIGGDYE